MFDLSSLPRWLYPVQIVGWAAVSLYAAQRGELVVAVICLFEAVLWMAGMLRKDDDE